MDNILDDYSAASGMGITPDMRDSLATAARWAKFIAIVGFVFMGLIFLFVLLFGSFYGTLLPGEMGLSLVPMLFLMGISLAISAIPLVFMYRFALQTQEGLRNEDQFAMTSAFANLKSYYKFIGILLIIVLGFYAIIFVGALFGGLFL